MELNSIVEALLFASQEPLGVPQMCTAVKETAKDILQAATESGEGGEGMVVPDWVALVLCFWSVREFRKVGMGWAFLVGLIMDVADASLMGQHTLAYVLLVYASSSFSRRVLWFPLVQQAMAATPDARVRELTTSLVRHLHAFVLETKLTEPEFEYALQFINAIGKATNERNNEAVLYNQQALLQQVQAAVLACTELEAIVDVRANVLPIYDSTSIHAQAALDFMLG